MQAPLTADRSKRYHRKIVLGGFAFSLLPKELMHYLRPDYGVNGDPDAFFAHFEDLQNGKLDQVANLLYYRRGRLVANPRQYFPPLASVEYTPQAILSMLDFYATFPSPGFRGAPVEIMRGCANRCRFCQARSQYYPLRQRSAQKILGLADKAYRSSGYEEISLCGLS